MDKLWHALVGLGLAMGSFALFGGVAAEAGCVSAGLSIPMAAQLSWEARAWLDASAAKEPLDYWAMLLDSALDTLCVAGGSGLGVFAMVVLT